MVVQSVVQHLLRETANLQDPRQVVFAVEQLIAEDEYLFRFFTRSDEEQGAATLRAFYAVKRAAGMQ